MSILIYQYDVSSDMLSELWLSPTANINSAYENMKSIGFTDTMGREQSIMLSIERILARDYKSIWFIKGRIGEFGIEDVIQQMYDGYIGKKYPELFL